MKQKLDKDNLNEVFGNKENAYYGHGTPYGEEIVNSIFENGLFCRLNSIKYTAICFGLGGTLEEDVCDKLDNWPHLYSDRVVILSMPQKYHILDSLGIGTFGQIANAYCYNIEGKGKYVMPEFVMGCYNANTQEFEQNPKYYEFLDEEQQQALFETVKENYAKTIELACGTEVYKEAAEDFKYFKYALTDEESEKYLDGVKFTPVDNSNEDFEQTDAVLDSID